MRRSSTPGPRRRTMIVTAAAAVALFGSVLPVHAAPPGDEGPPGAAAQAESGKQVGSINGALKGKSPVLSIPEVGDGGTGTEQWVWVRPR